MHEPVAVAKREKLFNIYSTTLQVMFGDFFAGRFLCPICSWMFERGDCVAKGEVPSLLNVAHAFPESCGGKVTTLTCRVCNDRMSCLETELAKTQRAFDHRKRFDAGEWIRVKSDTERREISAEIRRDPTTGGVQQKVITEFSNPTAREALLTECGGREHTVRVNFQCGDHDKSMIVMLHAAYLLLFATFGYAYVASSDTSWVRRILTSEEPVTVCPIVCVQRKIDAQVIETAGIVRIGHHRAAYAMIPPLVETTEPLAVLLPGVGKAGADDYAYISANWSDMCKLDAFFVPFWPRKQKAIIVDSLYTIWNEIHRLPR